MSKYINCKHIVNVSFYFSTESNEVVTYIKGSLNSFFDIIFFGFNYFRNKKENIYRNIILSETYTEETIYKHLVYHRYVDSKDGIVKNYPRVHIILDNNDNYDIYFKNEYDGIKYRDFLIQKSISNESFIDISLVLERLN